MVSLHLRSVRCLASLGPLAVRLALLLIHFIREFLVLPPLVCLLGVNCEDLLGILWTWVEDCRHLHVDVSLHRPLFLHFLAEEYVELDLVISFKELLIVDRLIIMSVLPMRKSFLS